MDPVISVSKLTKRYLIQAANSTRHQTIRDVVTGSFKNLLRFPIDFSKNNAKGGCKKEEFFALQDVNFKINAGERVGIVGRNGAGKSTLLKILSRITSPTSGKVTLRGRVSSLLEVGTGFHSELSGRENIFLNGAILGMPRKEIQRKFDSIVDFAEVEKFIDTPVKRYSSGMYVRLAFGVAAHLDSDILIVDEVLAVGDSRFQKKCMGHMESMSNSGRTILFVSHNMGAINQLCNRAIMLDAGKLVANGSVKDIVQRYLEDAGQSKSKDIEPQPELDIYLSTFNIENESGYSRDFYDLFEKIKIVIGYTVAKKISGLMLVLTVYRNGAPVFHTYSSDSIGDLNSDVGEYLIECHIPAGLLKAGIYTVDINTTTYSADFQKFSGIGQFVVDELSVSTTWKGFKADRLGEIIFPGIWLPPLQKKKFIL